MINIRFKIHTILFINQLALKFQILEIIFKTNQSFSKVEPSMRGGGGERIWRAAVSKERHRRRVSSSLKYFSSYICDTLPLIMLQFPCRILYKNKFFAVDRRLSEVKCAVVTSAACRKEATSRRHCPSWLCLWSETATKPRAVCHGRDDLVTCLQRLSRVRYEDIAGIKIIALLTGVARTTWYFWIWMDPSSLPLNVLCTKASHCRIHSFILCKVTKCIYKQLGVFLWHSFVWLLSYCYWKKLCLLYFHCPVYGFIHRQGGDICFS